ncbi:hypothetical protein K458DRAFT_375001 [Lentithecium fluviatile CBS 122367]|uniref:Zn(2)-C6 fungal-type domain-containing protein n=1 Tax=Lentithecium fluviatile CBS 122367 TaxID=1168545 RepID=A0A6G1INL6_9PLEO|nr:hypothetical protein K458DRAFT_375001 [Lentithecium fluviatile CBS 122367]
MVNVGGRSKGCSTCRRRRVKCDETRPVCNRCQRHGLGCDGPKDTVFIVGNIVGSRRRRNAAVTSPSRNARSKSPASLRIDVRERIANRLMAIAPPLKGNEFEVYICYSRTQLRSGAAIDLAMQKTHLSDLVTAGTHPSITNNNTQTFPRAILGFATILFGTQHRHPPITHKGYTLHGAALKQLNHALSIPNCHAQDEVLLSVATLAILECLVPTGPKTYLSHMIGLEKLLGLRNPEVFCSPLSLELYKSVRHMLIFASLFTGRPSILARPEWKKVLRASCREDELQEQDLFDVLADCTVLAAARNRLMADLQACADGSIDLRARKERGALSLKRRLRAWRKRWSSDEKNAYSETVMASCQESSTPTPLTFFDFATERAAILFMFYNTTLIHVLRILSSLLPKTPSAPSDQTLSESTSRDDRPSRSVWEIERDDYIAAESSAAINVCRCVPYYTPFAQKHTSPIVHWAVKTAWETLTNLESAEGNAMMGYLSTKIREVTPAGLWTG